MNEGIIFRKELRKRANSFNKLRMAVQPAMTRGVTPSINTDRISDIYSSAEKSVGAI